MDRKDIDFKDLSVSDAYSKFGLFSNPFPVTGVATEDPGFAPYDDLITEELVAFVSDTYTRQFFGGFLVIGEYGFGKTYILKHLERRINESLSTRGIDRACAIYVMNPRSSADKFISSILESFGLHNFLSLAWRLVTDRLSAECESRGAPFLEELFPKAKTIQMKIFDVQPDIQANFMRQEYLSNPMKFVDELHRAKVNLEGITKYAQQIFLRIFKVPEIAKALSSLTLSNEFESFSKMTECLDYSQFKKGLKKEIGEPEFFRAVMSIFRGNGYRHVYVLVDEFEDIIELGKRERMEYLAHLRDIIELNLEYFSIVLCVKRDAWARIAEAHPAFVERFSRNMELKTLNIEQAQNIITEYLSSVADNNNTKRKDPRFPFTLQAIKELVRKSAGVPRILVELCYVLVEHGAKSSQIEIIDEELARNVDVIRASLDTEKRRQMAI